MPSSAAKSKPSYAYAIIGVSLVLFMLGVLGWIIINGRQLTSRFKENITITTDFHDNTDSLKIARLQAILDRQPFRKASRIISKEEALKIQSQVEGQNLGEFLGYNPFFASLELNVWAEYANKDSIEKIRQFILQSNIVREVTYSRTQVKQMDANFRRINLILGGIVLVFIIIVVFLIDNTVRLAMFSNRFLIKTMQMVGATQSFISRPFDKRAIVNGLISGAIAIGFLLLGIFLVEGWQPEMKTLHNNGMLAMLMVMILVLGVVISLFSTHRSVIKYLKLHVDDLY